MRVQGTIQYDVDHDDGGGGYGAPGVSILFFHTLNNII